MMHTSLTKELRHQHGLPDDFDLYKFNWKESKRGPYMEVVGMCAPMLTSGERAWKYGSKKERKTFRFTKQQLSEMRVCYEKRTGICADCDGYEKTSGRVCGRCCGTKIPPPQPDASREQIGIEISSAATP